jgi:hypothetical protein
MRCNMRHKAVHIPLLGSLASQCGLGAVLLECSSPLPSWKDGDLHRGVAIPLGARSSSGSANREATSGTISRMKASAPFPTFSRFPRTVPRPARYSSSRNGSFKGRGWFSQRVGILRLRFRPHSRTKTSLRMTEAKKSGGPASQLT